MYSLMLDSGAFSVWSKGQLIDFDAYLDFCVQHPATSYFVNLDVIPGKPGAINSARKSDIEDACKLSWKRYQLMLKKLPIEKVIPVYHQHDDRKWLERYLKFGTPYIGISPANDRTTSQKLAWMDRDVLPIIQNSDGTVKVKTHGFAVTSHRLMKAFPWYSVDSSTWVRQAGNGIVYVPYSDEAGGFDFVRTPMQLAVSPRSPQRNLRNKHYFSLTPSLRAHVDKYFHARGMTIGEWRMVPSKKKKLPELPAEVPSFGFKVGDTLCYDTRTTGEEIETVTRGIATSRQMRAWLNAYYMIQANRVLPPEDIYFAGSVSFQHIEPRLQRRLCSYHYILESGEFRKTWELHYKIHEEMSSAS